MEILRKLAQLAGTDRTAIVYGDGTLSYRELNNWSDAFAAYLKKTVPEGKAPVLIYGHKELEIPACMFGSLKAGRGYVPVDVTYPPERVAQIAAEAKPCVIADLTGTLELPGLTLRSCGRSCTDPARLFRKTTGSSRMRPRTFSLPPARPESPRACRLRQKILLRSTQACVRFSTACSPAARF